MRCAETPGNCAPEEFGGAKQFVQSIYGDRLIMKVFRRQQAGHQSRHGDWAVPHRVRPASTTSLHLADRSSIACREGEPYTLAMLQGLVANEGDGWQWTLEELDRYYERLLDDDVSVTADSASSLRIRCALGSAVCPQVARDHVGAISGCGQQLGAPNGGDASCACVCFRIAAFAPEPYCAADLRGAARATCCEHAASCVRFAEGQSCEAAGRRGGGGWAGAEPPARYAGSLPRFAVEGCRRSARAFMANIIWARC